MARMEGGGKDGAAGRTWSRRGGSGLEAGSCVKRAWRWRLASSRQRCRQQRELMAMVAAAGGGEQPWWSAAGSFVCNESLRVAIVSAMWRRRAAASRSGVGSATVVVTVYGRKNMAVSTLAGHGEWRTEQQAMIGSRSALARRCIDGSGSGKSGP